MNSAAPHNSLKLSLRLKPRLVLKAIIAGQAAHQLASPPIIENAAEILARNASHSGKVALSNLLVDHNAAGSDIPTKVFRKLEQCPRDATFERQELPAATVSSVRRSRVARTFTKFL